MVRSYCYCLVRPEVPPDMLELKIANPDQRKVRIVRRIHGWSHNVQRVAIINERQFMLARKLCVAKRRSSGRIKTNQPLLPNPTAIHTLIEIAHPDMSIRGCVDMLNRIA